MCTLTFFFIDVINNIMKHLDSSSDQNKHFIKISQLLYFLYNIRHKCVLERGCWMEGKKESKRKSLHFSHSGKRHIWDCWHLLEVIYLYNWGSWYLRCAFVVLCCPVKDTKYLIKFVLYILRYIGVTFWELCLLCLGFQSYLAIKLQSFIIAILC